MRTKRATISKRIGGRARWGAPAAASALIVATCGGFGTAGATVVPTAAGAPTTPAPAIADTTTVAVGKSPVAVAINQKTNKIYVANNKSKSVTVIDGATNKTTSVTVGEEPVAIAVNPNTNKIYVANQHDVDKKGIADPNGNGFVTVIDGATNKTTKVPAQLEPGAVAINPNTNKIYVTNEGSNQVTVIDGKTNKATTLDLRKDGAALEEGVLSPHDVQVNLVTDTVYVTGPQSNTVAMIDGKTNKVSIVHTGFTPTNSAINPKTNQTFVTDFTTNDLTVIDGKTRKTSTLPLPPEVQDPIAVAVNPNTNKVYVANLTSRSITVIDAATKVAKTFGDLPGKPHDVAINPVTNKIYFPCFVLYKGKAVGNDKQISGLILELDGATNKFTAVISGITPYAVAVNPKTNKTYVANQDDNSVTVLTESATPGGKGHAAPKGAVSPAVTAQLPPATRSRELRPLN